MKQKVTLFAVSLVLFYAPSLAQMKTFVPNFNSFTPTPKYENENSLQKVNDAASFTNPDFGFRFDDAQPSWLEQYNLRTATSRSFVSADGEVIKEYAATPINYKDHNGYWRSIDCRIKPVANGWAALQQPYPTFLYHDGSTAITASDGRLIFFNRNTYFNHQALHISNYSAGDDGMKISGAFTHTDATIEFREHTVESSYILQSPPVITGNFLIFSEEIELPSGFFFEKNVLEDAEIAGWWKGELLVKSSYGNTELTFAPSIIYDSNSSVPSSISGEYRLTDLGGNSYKLECRVPAEWLNDVERVYPVTIDPLVTGSTSNWAGGSTPSCYMPAFYKDSLSVIIPAGVTITAFYVTANYYATGVNGTVMLNGNMYFMTTCGRDPINPNLYWNAPSQFAGHALMVNIDMKNTLTCCYSPSCTAQNFILQGYWGRNYPPINTSCNTTYLYYDDVYQNNYKFHAYIVGKTVETLQTDWSINEDTSCMGQCTLTLNATANYGVPPYTFSHPWMTGSITEGSYGTVACGSTDTATLTLTVPNCPVYCAASDTLIVPPPAIVDACGTTVTGLSDKTVIRTSAVQITANPNSLSVCSGSPINVALSSCSGTTINWTGSNGTSGTGNILDVVTNNSCNPLEVDYTVSVQGNCGNQSISVPVTINPIPVASFNINPTSICAGTTTTITFTGSACTNAIYNWSFGGGTIISGSGAGPYTVLWSTAGNKTISLSITEFGCTSNTASQNITVSSCAKPTAPVVSNVTNSSATLSWSGSACSGPYIVQYKKSTQSNGTQIIVSGTSVTINGLSPNTIYNWRVQKKCSSTIKSAFKIGNNFTTLLRLENSESTPLDGEVFPNPAAGSFSISLSGLKENEKLEVILYTALGQAIDHVVLIPDGTTALLNFTIKEGAGLYFIRVIQAGSEFKKAIVNE